MTSPTGPAHRRTDRRARLRGLRPVGRVVGALVSVALLVVAGYAWLSYRDLDAGLTRLPGIAVGPGHTGGDGGNGGDVDGRDQNILLVGNDDRSTLTDAEVRELKVGRDGGSLATDTMMIVHIPADGSRATLISLPRDTRVQVPGHGETMLNAPYSLAYTETTGSRNTKRTAGANLLLDTVRNLTGLTFDSYVQVDLLGFYYISKVIGGVPVVMCKAVNDTVEYNRAHGETDGGGSGLVLPKGRSVISGVKALEFVRQRHGFPTGDQYRVKRQQYFLTAAFREVATVGIITKLRELGDALDKSVFFGGDIDVFQLAKQLGNLTADHITGRTIPVDLASGHIDPVRVKRFVAALVHPSAAPSRPASPAPSRSAPAGRKPAVDQRCIY